VVERLSNIHEVLVSIPNTALPAPKKSIFKRGNLIWTKKSENNKLNISS
jgi:hypothetical protein